MRKLLFAGAAFLAVLTLTACDTEQNTTPGSQPAVLTNTTAAAASVQTAALSATVIPYTETTSASASVTAVSTVSTDTQNTVTAANTSSSAAVSSVSTTLSAGAGTRSSLNTTFSTVSTVTTTVLTTSSVIPQQIFTPIAGEWYVNGDPAQGRLTINAQGVFTAYDGKNKVTAVGQAKHETVTNQNGSREIRYNLYSNYTQKIVVSILDTGAASYSELISGTDTKVYYAPKGKRVQMPDEAARKKIVQEAAATVQALEKLSAGNIVIASGDVLPANDLYTKVVIAPAHSEIEFKSAAEIRRRMEEKLTGVAKAKYAGLVSGDMPQYLDVNGVFYALPVVRSADYAWENMSITLGAAAERSFAAEIHYTENNTVKKKATLTFLFENGSWKLSTIEEK